MPLTAPQVVLVLDAQRQPHRVQNGGRRAVRRVAAGVHVERVVEEGLHAAERDGSGTQEKQNEKI